MPANAAMASSINPPEKAPMDIVQDDGTMTKDVDEIMATAANDTSDIEKDDVQPANAIPINRTTSSEELTVKS
jgi:hypothetical protein